MRYNGRRIEKRTTLNGVNGWSERRNAEETPGSSVGGSSEREA